MTMFEVNFCPIDLLDEVPRKQISLRALLVLVAIASPHLHSGDSKKSALSTMNFVWGWPTMHLPPKSA